MSASPSPGCTLLSTQSLFIQADDTHLGLSPDIVNSPPVTMDVSAHRRLQLVQEVFEEALTYPTGEARNRFIDDVLTRAPDIAAEVDRLLRHYAAIEPVIGLTLPRFGPYQAVRIVGRGGMGIVYEAKRTDGEFERRVAVKVIAAAGFITKILQDELRRERQILAHLDHPGIARLFDGGVDETGAPYQIIEFIDGAHLDSYCDEHNLNAADRLSLFLRVLNAVEYAHSRQIAHLDLKPSNILVEGEGCPKLLDFGAARLIRAGDPTLTARFFTPDYASPELMAGKSVDQRSDIYSLGVLYKKLLGPHARLFIVNKSTASDAQHRYANVAEFRRALQSRRWSAASMRSAMLLLLLASLFVGYTVRSTRLMPNRKAKDLYELAQYHWSRRTPDSLDKAIVALQKATAADHNYSDAYGLLAYCYAMLPNYHRVFDPQYGSRGKQAARRALALDPQSFMAHMALGILYLHSDWNWSAAEAEYKTAVGLAPHLALPHQSYGMGLITQSRFADAELQLRLAEKLEPRSLIAKINVAQLWYYAHRFDLEESKLRQILELDPNYVLAYVMLSKQQLIIGHDQQAIDLSKRLLSLPEGQNWCFHLAEAYAHAGRHAEAVEQIKVCPQVPAEPYVYLADYAHALSILETLYAHRDPQALYFKVDPVFDVLHGQPRFDRLLKGF